MPWLTLGDEHLTEAEHDAIAAIDRVVGRGDAGMVTTTVLDIDAQPLTTVTVIQRPAERLAFVVRADRSIVVATDDILALRWRDS